MRNPRCVTTVATFLWLVPCMGTAFAQLAGARHDASTLEGSWNATVVMSSTMDAPSGDRRDAGATMLQSFTHEGSVIETTGRTGTMMGEAVGQTTSLRQDVASVSTGHGTWVRSDSATDTFFYGVQHILFDSAGLQIGIAHLNASATLSSDRQRYSGDVVAEFFDMDGQRQRLVMATVAAERITLTERLSGANGR